MVHNILLWVNMVERMIPDKFPNMAKGLFADLCTKISLTKLVKGLVLSVLPIYFNALERTTLLASICYL